VYVKTQVEIASIKPVDTQKVLFAMLLGVIAGLALNFLQLPPKIDNFLVEGVFAFGGQVFITLMKMLVVPVVFVSLVCGASSLGHGGKIGRIGGKALLLYVLTTAAAISLGIFFAITLNIGSGAQLAHVKNTFAAPVAPSLFDTLLKMFPSNPIAAMAQGEMMQIILFSVLMGIAISFSGERGQRISDFLHNMNAVVATLVTMIFRLTPYGVFCLLASLFARVGFQLIGDLMGYFFTVLGVLILHGLVVNGFLLVLLGRLNPITFFKKFYPVMIFAFSTSSSTATIPVTLETTEYQLGVKRNVASFLIPLGATINMNGTAIMQGIATVFIAQVYGIEIGIAGYATVVLMATIAAVGTAGIPSVGLITLVMVLNQVGVPADGITLIIGVDRILDMTRTVVNTMGDAVVACVVAKSEDQFDQTVYDDPNAGPRKGDVEL
jgi:Na+/H+-dicarboxylate symporter